jgi:hypothetical protein
MADTLNRSGLWSVAGFRRNASVVEEKPPLINTAIHRGELRCGIALNRFNGFPRANG